MMQPNFSSNERMTSTGIAEPPETHSRRLDMSCVPASGECSMPANIVGTPSKTVTLSRSTTDSAFDPSKRGISVSSEPRRTAVLRPQVSPNTWNRGRQPMITSSAVLHECLGGGAAVARQVAVGELGALGLTGRAGGVEDDREVLVGALHRALQGVLAHQFLGQRG